LYDCGCGQFGFERTPAGTSGDRNAIQDRDVKPPLGGGQEGDEQMRKAKIITPHLWFDTQAKQAAGFYTSVLPNSHIKSTTTIENTPSGTAEILTIELAGQEFTLISAGPLFRFNPSVSFLVACETKGEVTALWEPLSEGGSPLMELGEYPFSKRYGWVQDRYGLSWQVMFMGDLEIRQKITPTLMFTGEVCGKAEEAIRHYTAVFPEAKVGDILRYGPEEEPDAEGTVKHASFTLLGREFAAMDSARVRDIAFNEAISFVVHCDSQEEIDHYWGKLSAHPEAEQCGWLKDKYGLSWQIVPAILDEMLGDRDRNRSARVTEAFLKMKKFDIGQLENAYRGKPYVTEQNARPA
jgi:predicted 3-demethylubiquinone-9 3-methyltransferase (glyoxalase superfamily)